MSQPDSLFRDLGEGRYHLNLVGYGCPHVQLYAEKALQRLSIGHHLTITFDSPASGETLAWLIESDPTLTLERQASAGTLTWQVRRQ